MIEGLMRVDSPAQCDACPAARARLHALDFEMLGFEWFRDLSHLGRARPCAMSYRQVQTSKHEKFGVSSLSRLEVALAREMAHVQLPSNVPHCVWASHASTAKHALAVRVEAHS